MRMRHVLGPITVLAVLAPGCSDDDAAPPTSAFDVDDGATTITANPGSELETAAPTSLTPASDTTATAPVPTTPPITEGPTTATLPVEEQVRAAMLGYYDFYWRCLRAPSECDPLEVAVPDSDAFRALTSTRDDLIEGNYFVGDEDVGHMVITAIEPAGDHTLVTTCWYSTAWLYFRPPIPDAPPIVQNNTPGSSVETFQFVQMPDLTWKLRRADGVGEEVPNENRCPPET